MRRDVPAMLKVTAARYLLGAENANTLNQAADRALDAGLYNDALARLATEFGPESPLADAGPVFEAALAQLGLSLPSRADAVWIALRDVISRVAQGEVRPRVGLYALNALYDLANLYEQSRGTVGDSHDLQKLLGAYWGYDDLEDSPQWVSFEGRYGADAMAALDAAVVEEAKEWLARHSA